MYCNRFNIGFGVFRSNENHCKIFKIKCHVEVVFFRPWIWPMLMENTQNPPFLHVKRENTRKTDTKMVLNGSYFDKFIILIQIIFHSILFWCCFLIQKHMKLNFLTRMMKFKKKRYLLLSNLRYMASLSKSLTESGIPGWWPGIHDEWYVE